MEKNFVTAIVMATMGEAKPFVLGMDLDQVSETPFKIFKKNNIFLIASGVGKANAAMATAYVCNEYDPEYILNFGAAGGLDFSSSLGDIYQVDKIIESDRPDLRSNEPYSYEPDILEGFKNKTLSTSDKAVLDPEKRKEISEYAELVDMEGASIVQACKLFKKKCYLFKFVSDTPEHTDGMEIVRNIKDFRTKMYDLCIQSVFPALQNK